MVAVIASAASDSFVVSTARATAGTGRLRIVTDGRRSVVAEVRAGSPLRLLTPRNHGHAAWVYTSTYGGGLVDGDAIDLSVEVAVGATTFLSTQAATKVYRSPGGTSHRLTAHVAAGATFVLWPDPVIAFRDARYAQDQIIEIDDDATLVVVDWLTSGRYAAGERWAFTEYRSRLSITCGGRLVCHDALTLAAADGPVGERLGRFDVLAAVAIVGAAVREHGARIEAHVAAQAVERQAACLVTAAPIAGPGTFLRVAGTSFEDVRRQVREHLSFVPALLGDDPWTRKW